MPSNMSLLVLYSLDLGICKKSKSFLLVDTLCVEDRLLYHEDFNKLAGIC